MMPRNTRLSDSYTPDRCRFSKTIRVLHLVVHGWSPGVWGSNKNGPGGYGAVISIYTCVKIIGKYPVEFPLVLGGMEVE